MTEPDTFQNGTNWQQSSGPHVIRDALESDCWPVDDNSGSGTKDQLAEGLHPVIALGGRTAADGRPLNLTGVVTSFQAGGTTATGRVRVNIADGMVVRQYVANVLTYSGGAANTFEQAPVPFQPVYVDDSDDLSEGVTLSMSELNDADVRNPLRASRCRCLNSTMLMCAIRWQAISTTAKMSLRIRPLAARGHRPHLTPYSQTRLLSKATASCSSTRHANCHRRRLK
jgi:hypothetical protein